MNGYTMDIITTLYIRIGEYIDGYKQWMDIIISNGNGYHNYIIYKD